MKSDEYWFEDGNLLLTCDDLLFLVHQSVLSRLSAKFRDVIKKIRVEDTPNVQLKVPGNGKSWTMFLSLVYPSNSGDEHERLSQTEWFIIYDVARLYAFDGIRRVALTEITSNIEKFIDLVKLGKNQFSETAEWCIQGYKGLCERERPLSLDEARELGIEDTVKIAEAREKLIRGATWEEVAERFMW
ncbi:hypothetical protein SCHPADRAFT_226149 [Schizopora paradoxa]|uniref:BTB domain-containing protein n=1 Tax=Schizopora paradoxa TaxID=27342 RepID=A0A0H2S370_9AGAM|nr:hypothetical protein SCHPADRAFT_226149 [Schizopora paradoxa]